MSTVSHAWNAIRAILQDNFTFYEIKLIVGLANFDVTAIAYLEQRPGGGASKGQLITAIDREYGNLSENEKKHFISIIIEEILKRKDYLAKEIEEYLNRLGLTIVEGKVIPVGLLDSSELAELPECAHIDLVKALQRYRDGDLSGAISSACAAIDAVTTGIYQEKNIGDPSQASFQERCKKSIKALGILSRIKDDLEELGWERSHLFINNFEGSLNQAAYVLQSLRSKMGDVHGTKPTLKPLVFDSLMWASLILRILNER